MTPLTRRQVVLILVAMVIATLVAMGLMYLIDTKGWPRWLAVLQAPVWIMLGRVCWPEALRR